MGTRHSVGKEALGGVVGSTTMVVQKTKKVRTAQGRL